VVTSLSCVELGTAQPLLVYSFFLWKIGPELRVGLSMAKFTQTFIPKDMRTIKITAINKIRVERAVDGTSIHL